MDQTTASIESALSAPLLADSDEEVDALDSLKLDDKEASSL
jgi:hypothetical protein